MARFEFKSLQKINLRILQGLPDAQRRMTVSSYVTVVRIVLTPVVVLSMWYGWWGAAFALFVVAAMTDMLDGSLARLRDEQTFLGACLDPLADKFLILACFFTLACFQATLFTIPQWFVWTVLCKELLQIFGAIGLYCYKGYLSICPTLLGKVTTVAQMGFIGWLFACYFLQWVPIKTYYTMLGTLLLLLGVTFCQYVVIGIRFFRS